MTSYFRPDVEIWSFSQCVLGYVADSTFHRTHFQLECISISWKGAGLQFAVSCVYIAVTRGMFTVASAGKRSPDGPWQAAVEPGCQLRP